MVGANSHVNIWFHLSPGKKKQHPLFQIMKKNKDTELGTEGTENTVYTFALFLAYCQFSQFRTYHRVTP